MALSGSQTIPLHGGAHTLIVEWSASQNIGGNNSTITANLYLKGNYSYSTIYSGSVAKSVALIINGNRKNGTARIDISGTEKRLLLSHTVTVGHNADGTKTVRLEGMLNSQITWSSTYYGSEQWTRKDWGLNTIPRASTFNQSSTTFTMDAEGTIYINPASTSFTHKLYMWFGKKRILLRDNPPVKQNFTVRFRASDFGDQISNNETSVGNLVLETYSGGRLIGSNQRTTYLRLPANYVPSQPSITVTDESSVPSKLSVAKTAGIYVKGMSLLRFTCSSSGVLGSTITNYQVKIGTFVSNGTGAIEVDLSKFDVGVGTVQAVVTVKDSRGRTNSRTVPLTIQDYSPPVINGFSAVRQNNGETVVITKPVRVASILNGASNINSYTVKTEYKRVSVSAWTVNRTETNSSATLTLSGFSAANSYDIRVTVTDKMNQTVVTASISTAKTLVDFHRDLGLGVGKMHERGALDVGGDMYVSKKIYQNNQPLVDQGTYRTLFDTQFTQKFPASFEQQYAAKTEVVNHGTVKLPYGINASVQRIGKLVNLVVTRQIKVWNNVGENKLASEKLPDWAIPSQDQTLILAKNAGNFIDEAPLLLYLMSNGEIRFTSKTAGDSKVYTGSITYFAKN